MSARPERYCTAGLAGRRAAAGRRQPERLSAACPLWTLLVVCSELQRRGLRPVLNGLLSEGPVRLSVADLVIQASEVDGRCILVTEDGEVLGFGDDAGIIDDLAAQIEDH